MAKKKNSRTAAGSGSIRQRRDGRWEARVTVGKDTATGKPVRRSIYGATQAEVRAALTKVLRELDTGTYQKPEKMTVSAWMDDWMETFARNSIKPLTAHCYQIAIRTHINPSIGALELQSVRGIHIQKVYNKMTDAGLSAATVTRIGSILHRAFDAARKQGIIPVNPCDNAELPKGKRHDIAPFTDDEIPLFLSAIDNHRFRNAYALCLFAGLREAECLGLSWKQVDFQNSRITINQQLQFKPKQGYWIASTTKSGKPRTIAPPKIAFEYLRAERVKQAESRLRAGELWDNPDDLVFTDEMGKHYAIPTFFRNYKRIVTSIGRPDARIHDMRHTAATIAIAAGSDIKSVQALMGHSSAAFTLNVYTHASERMMEDTAARMQGYYDGLKRAAKG